MDTTAFHVQYRQDCETIKITIPGTVTTITTNVRFLEIVNEPAKLQCPLQKIFEL